MSGGGRIGRARELLAGAVTAAGIRCDPYPPETVVAPAAWIDSLTIDYQNGASFSLPGRGEAVIIAAGQRNDRSGASRQLEELVPGTVAALEGVEGVLVTQVQSGRAEVNNQVLPAVLYTAQFHFTS